MRVKKVSVSGLAPHRLCRRSSRTKAHAEAARTRDEFFRKLDAGEFKKQ